MKNLFLSNSERHQLLVEWNTHDFAYPTSMCIHQLFEAQAERIPNDIALVFEETTLTYEECNQRANQVAHYLLDRGIGPEMTVGIYLEHSETLLVAILGILKAGAAYVPLDTRHPADRLSFLLQDARVSAILTQESLRGNLPELSGISPICLDTDWRHIAEYEATNPASRAIPENIAFVLYTSGSTGVPKGVMTTHANLVSTYVAWEKSYGLRSDVSSFCQMANFSFVVFQADWIRALCSGGKLVLCSLETVLTPYKLYHTMVREQVDFAEFVPAVLRNLLQYLEETRQSLEFLRLLVIGSDRWYYQEHQQVRDFCGPDTRLIHSFGLTETTVDSAYFEQTTVLVSSGQLTPIGRPFPHVQMYVLDKRLNPVPVGVVGHLYISGFGLARGYLHDPLLTAQKFLPHPFLAGQEGENAAGSRLYETGDMARYLPDGNIQFLGRMDHQIKVRGFRVEMGEIETALCQHPAVREAVVAVEEQTAGDAHGDARLTAYIVPTRQPLADMTDQHLYKLPNQKEVASLNHAETHQLYQEIFEEQLYTRHGITIREGDCIFDVGANIGMFTLFAHQHCKDVAIYAFEPAPPAFEMLSINVALHGVNARLFNFGLASTARSDTFTFYPDSSGMSSFYPNKEEEEHVLSTIMLNQRPRQQRAGLEYLQQHMHEWLEERFQAESFSCSLRTLSQVLAEQQLERIDLLKVVVQKSEWEVLAGIQEDDWSKIRQLVLEVYDMDGRVQQIRYLLEQHGYQVWVEQAPLFQGSTVYLMYAHRPLDTPDEITQSSKQTYAAAPLLAPSTVSASELYEFLRDKVADYMLPSRIVFLNALPLTATGKIDRRALSAFAHKSVETDGQDRQFVAPRTETESTLSRIWASVLELDRVGIYDDFFHLGGHSLLATQVISRVRQAFNVELPVRSFLRIRTISELAGEIERLKEMPTTPVEEIRPVARDNYRRSKCFIRAQHLQEVRDASNAHDDTALSGSEGTER